MGSSGGRVFWMVVVLTGSVSSPNNSRYKCFKLTFLYVLCAMGVVLVVKWTDQNLPAIWGGIMELNIPSAKISEPIGSNSAVVMHMELMQTSVGLEGSTASLVRR